MNGGCCAGCCARPASRLAQAEELSDADRDWLDAWFMERVFPVLTPLAVDPAHPFPFIPNMALCMVLKLVREEDGGTMRALLPLPPQIDRFIRLPRGASRRRRSASCCWRT